MLPRSLALSWGAQVVTHAVAATGVAFLALSACFSRIRRDFSFMGGLLFADIVVALIAGLAAAFMPLPALRLAVAAMVALLSARLILHETSRIVTGGETHRRARCRRAARLDLRAVHGSPPPVWLRQLG